MQPVPHERVVDIDEVDDPVVGVELQAAELTAAGSGLAAEQRRMETERAREIACCKSWSVLHYRVSPIGFLAG